MQDRVQSASRVTSEQSIVQRLETLRAAFAKIEAVTGKDTQAMVASCPAQRLMSEASAVTATGQLHKMLSLLNGLLV